MIVIAEAKDWRCGACSRKTNHSLPHRHEVSPLPPSIEQRQDPPERGGGGKSVSARGDAERLENQAQPRMRFRSITCQSACISSSSSKRLCNSA